ncbi:ionotropic receptor 25a isoform X2 [Daktulosphaira vitifoliae]|uniref:ionotropic receptor 25a isoform X2 n=1 Tax=Daktulosphaira vitifoliae TaxID=58002 RepID=UPI0021AAFF78|nr:ionotropic receptor 25a isoform X2 [Daktulosphaira vitifoliae]
MYSSILILFSCIIIFAKGETYNIGVLTQNESDSNYQILLNSSKNYDISLRPIIIDSPFNVIGKFCKSFNDTLCVVDILHPHCVTCRNSSNANGFPYFQTDFSSMRSVIKLIESYVKWMNFTKEITFIFTNQADADEAIIYLTSGVSSLRAIVFSKLTDKEIDQIKNTKIGVRFVALVGGNIENYLKTARNENLIKHDDSWIIVTKTTSIMRVNTSVTLIKIKSWEDGYINITSKADNLLKFVRHIVTNLPNNQLYFKCNIRSSDEIAQKRISLLNTISIYNFTNHLRYNVDTSSITYDDVAEIYKIAADGSPKQLGSWTAENGLKMENEALDRVIRQRFFRIGTAQSIPWTFLDETDGKWKGYCIDLIEKLSKEMNFKYELIIKKDIGIPNRVNKSWNGLVKGLIEGELDIVVAALAMTSEREEVIDFIAPYFEQTGISIVIRKPTRKTSLFKFMTVLKPEVWLSIVGALTMTAFMIWILDKYSPYSAQNNKPKYEQFRNFTLVESFWFALTSFTPQGGGETPKAISGRVLVAAYWVFVVLMLATFTANLAAFLTVERMQTPVQSLQQLARQSRINYSVVEGSPAHFHFKNMKKAEDILYNVWKELALNQKEKRHEFRVWDYPIKEEYGQILAAIERTGTVPNRTIGYQMVLDNEQGEFAFIHDSSDIKHEVYNNCNLTEVGEIFAERPYSIAVQQGSLIQEEISRKILDLQKDRFFESLNAKYWNSSKLSMCPNADDSEGITLESLGGVFIATLVGLMIALITLAFEVIYFKHKRAKITEGNLLKLDDKKYHKEQLMYGHELLMAVGRNKAEEQKHWASRIKLDSTTKRINNALFFRRQNFNN